ncbi:MAG: AbrB/MazE/SpoVT family DNA-binding domain-containing protein [Thermodesulfobacteriota bacterium]
MVRGDFSHKYDAGRLWDRIKQGKSAKEIMKELGISRWTLKEQLLILQNRTGKYYEVPGLFEDESERQPKVHYQREGIIFSDKMLDKTGFQAGDEFEMIVEKDRIILQKIG